MIQGVSEKVEGGGGMGDGEQGVTGDMCCGDGAWKDGFGGWELRNKKCSCCCVVLGYFMHH